MLVGLVVVMTAFVITAVGMIDDINDAHENVYGRTLPAAVRFRTDQTSIRDSPPPGILFSFCYCSLPLAQLTTRPKPLSSAV
jgi:hypothetical protein